MNEHTVEPEFGTIREDEGQYIGNYAAKCNYCGADIEGNENTAWHTDE